MRSGVSSFQPERMLQAREARGLTQAAIAVMIGKSPSTVSKWENGSQTPELPALAALAQSLGVPEQFLLRPVPEMGASPYFFRSNQAITKEAQSIARRRLEWLNEISIALQDWVDWPVITVPRLGTGDYRKLNDSDIEDFAAECRRQWQLGNGPIENVTLVLENAGVICVREPLGYDRMDGVSKWFATDSRPYVFLAADKANGIRGRFDAAHELGHLVMHWDVATIDYARQPELERQAHLFAAAFLLPSETFAAEVSSPSLDTFLALKTRWKVSIAAMIMRCKQLGIIDDAYAVRLWKNYSARGWRRGEPNDDVFPVEHMRLIPRAISLIVESTQMSRLALLDRLGLFGGDTASLCSLPEGYFDAPAQLTRLEPRVRGLEGGTMVNGTATVLSFPPRR
ncbi:MAG: ImmA/IrrE family metallo-endopeptidase [Herbaspirillum sp.]|uniref:helix-turn-helix domain-containing protein n=2 Tax=Herbaspirillum sp. TaxID=1890675 RepID=UPI00258DAFA8|nr:ImmA/IrrE family metallo-endopeptidase [Herbaspirillum sp.]MCP3656994.1 ImmA/IrrE family metallo-endopeptidase [Herbaspirillum sp.]MCP3947660.1 ImmA/IrrE family metallo-endopeptidase [Herbaspirillum sp.]MCP4029885.1 ImmA/IrrE family metallo-endopeptidase [Herbaspirillum sp.]MCP4557251.1 ImmA/IrrE family metallo-endopeptidase [Herbaspirillum sp.]